MKRGILLLSMIVFCLGGAGVSQPPITTLGEQRPVDEQLHQKVVTLVEVMHVREKLEANREKMFLAGKERMLQRHPQYNPEFTEQWLKRMQASVQLDDYVKLVVSLYEKYYEVEDVTELIEIQRKLNASKHPTISPRLKARVLMSAAPMQNEMLSGFSELGGNLGRRVGMQLSSEHPEWLARADMPH